MILVAFWLEMKVGLASELN